MPKMLGKQAEKRAGRAIARPARFSDNAVAAALALGLLAGYLLTFAGVLRSIDELALFGMAEHWVQAGRLEPVLVWFAPYHNQVGAFEPGYPLLAAPLYWLGSLWPAVSNIHAVMLLNPLLTAATAALLYRFARRLGYAAPASLAVALGFGLASMAWPYTKSFLREPAVALLLVAGFWAAWEAGQRPGWRGPAAVALVAGLLAVSVKISSLAFWPALAVLALAPRLRGRLRPAVAAALGAAGLALAVLAGFALLAWRGLDAPRLVRDLLLLPFSAQGWLAWYGLLLSPGKSVFLYSPVLALGVLGWPGFYRRHPSLALALALAWVVLVFVLGISVWGGGLTWGPRFLLPLVPVSLLPAAELLPRRPWAVALAGLSALYQAAVAVMDWSRPYAWLFARYPGQDLERTVGLDWARWAESPAVLILRLWGRPGFDLAWQHAGLAGELKLDPVLALALAAAALLALAAAVAVWRGRPARPALALSAVAMLLALPILLWRGAASLPDSPALAASTARQLADRVNTDPTRPAELIVVSPDFGTHAWLGLVKQPRTRIWISPAQAEGFERLLPASNLAAGPGAVLSVVVDRPHIASHYPGDALTSWLNTFAYRLGNDWVEGYERLQYAAPPNPAPPQTLALTWDTGLTLVEAQVPAQVPAGSALLIDLVFQCDTADWARADRLFANLIGPDGSQVAGQESLPQHGNLAAAGCQPGEDARDRRGLWIPAGTPAATYTLVVGFANDAGFVPGRQAGGATHDYVPLAEITVVR